MERTGPLWRSLSFESNVMSAASDISGAGSIGSFLSPESPWPAAEISAGVEPGRNLRVDPWRDILFAMEDEGGRDCRLSLP